MAMQSHSATASAVAPAALAASGAAHHADPSAHAPQPSAWPILLALGIGIFSTGFFLVATGFQAVPLLALAGILLVLIPALGWATTIAAERRHQDPVYTFGILRRGFLYFLLSEGSIFGSFFAHNLYIRFGHATTWPPLGAPRLETSLPGIGTLLLVLSSFTYHWSHHAFTAGKRAVSKNWLMATIILGVVFLAIQGYDWGFLKAFDKFTYSQGVFGSQYYWMTGFHGLHVCVGLLFLALVYWRMERGELDQTYNFSLSAAEYYWHFVDIVWIFLFFIIYLI